MALLRGKTQTYEQVVAPYLVAVSRMEERELTTPITADGKRWSSKALFLINNDERWAYALGKVKHTVLFKTKDPDGTPLIVLAFARSKQLAQFYAERHPETFQITYSTIKEAGRVKTSIGGEIAGVHPDVVVVAAKRNRDILNTPSNERAQDKVAHVLARFYATHTRHGTRESEHAQTASEILGLLRGHESYLDTNLRGYSPKSIVAAVHKQEASRLTAHRMKVAREGSGKPVKAPNTEASGPLKIATESSEHHHFLHLRRNN